MKTPAVDELVDVAGAAFVTEFDDWTGKLKLSEVTT